MVTLTATQMSKVEVDQTPKRSVHGRQPTAFVKKAKVSTGQAGMANQLKFWDILAGAARGHGPRVVQGFFQWPGTGCLR